MFKNDKMVKTLKCTATDQCNNHLPPVCIVDLRIQQKYNGAYDEAHLLYLTEKDSFLINWAYSY